MIETAVTLAVELALDRANNDSSGIPGKCVFFLAQQIIRFTIKEQQTAIQLWWDNCDDQDFNPPTSINDLRILVESLMDSVRYPAGVLVDNAKERAKHSTKTWGDYKPRMQYLLRVCNEMTTDGEFFITQKQCAEILACSIPVAKAWIQRFIKDGVLEITKQGKKRFATHYRFKPKKADSLH